MCAVPSANTSTPYRTPLLPPSRSSFFSDFNHLTNSVAPSPCNRRIQTMQQRKAPLDSIETNSSSQKESTAQQQARICVAKVKFALILLAVMATVSVLFALLAIQTCFTLQPKVLIDSDRMAAIGSVNIREIRMIIYEVSNSITLIAIITSIAACFLSTIQLFFALKMLKTNPTAAKRVQTFLDGGRFLRCIIYTAWFIGVFLFIAGCMLHSMLVLLPFGSVSKGIGVAFSIASLFLCAIGAVHCVYTWTLSQNQHEESDLINGNLSTLV